MPPNGEVVAADVLARWYSDDCAGAACEPMDEDEEAEAEEEAEADEAQAEGEDEEDEVLAEGCVTHDHGLCTCCCCETQRALDRGESPFVRFSRHDLPKPTLTFNVLDGKVLSHDPLDWMDDMQVLTAYHDLVDAIEWLTSKLGWGAEDFVSFTDAAGGMLLAVFNAMSQLHRSHRTLLMHGVLSLALRYRLDCDCRMDRIQTALVESVPREDVQWHDLRALRHMEWLVFRVIKFDAGAFFRLERDDAELRAVLAGFSVQ